MKPNTQRTLYVFLVFLIMSSLACMGTSILNDPEVREVLGDPIIKRPTPTSIYDLTDEREAEYQPYLGTSQTESIAVEKIPGITNCPPADVDLSPNAEVKYEIEGNILTATDAMGSRDYQYNGPTSNHFSRQLPDGSGEVISFDTINGINVANLRRYLHEGDQDSLAGIPGDRRGNEGEMLLVYVAPPTGRPDDIVEMKLVGAKFGLGAHIVGRRMDEKRIIIRSKFSVSIISSRIIET